MADDDIREGKPPRKRKAGSIDDDSGRETRSKKAGGSSTLLMILGGLGLVTVTFCCCLPGGVGGYFWWSAKVTAEERQKKVESEAGIVVSSIDMGKHYAENFAGADAKYKDKVVTVTGRILFIDGDSVRLEPGVPPGMLVIGGVYCNFGEKYKSQVANFRLNEIVTIRGYCTGQGFAETGKLIYCKKIEGGADKK